MSSTRRQFLSHGALVLAGVSTGVISLTGCGSSPGTRVDPSPPPGRTGPASAGFSWSLANLNNNSAYAYFEVVDAMVLQAVDVDATLQPSLSGAPAATQALCRGWISRGAPPALINGSSAAPGPTSASTDFGAVSVYNSAGLAVDSDAAALQDVFYSASLRSWVPLSGVDASSARSVSVAPVLALNAGDYLVFGIQQQGMVSNVALQATLRYQ